MVLLFLQIVFLRLGNFCISASLAAHDGTLGNAKPTESEAEGVANTPHRAPHTPHGHVLKNDSDIWQRESEPQSAIYFG